MKKTKIKLIFAVLGLGERPLKLVIQMFSTRQDTPDIEIGH